MKRLAALALFLALMGFCAAAVATQPAPGDYLEDGFLAALSRTRSPFVALSEGGHAPQSINVKKTRAGQRFFANANWHEGYTLFILRADGGMDQGEEGFVYPKPIFDVPHHFRFLDPRTGRGWTGYTYVGDADATVARLSLAGTYLDDGGREIAFGANGSLHGIGKATRFWLDNDHVLGNRFDFFHLDDGSVQTLAFRHDAPRLVLFPLVPVAADDPNSVGAPDFKHALMTLTPASLVK